MKLGRLNHIGVATPSIADAIVFYRDVMGATLPTAPQEAQESDMIILWSISMLATDIHFKHDLDLARKNGARIWCIDTYETHDNLGLWLDKSCLQYFGSTAAPSILSFYPALGVKRDVRSEPELSNYALRGLLSVEYLITTPEKQTDFENEADDGWEYAFAKDGYAVYRNTNYVPMGFAYDYYLTQTEYEETAKATRANLLMRALVLTDEDAAVYGKYLTHLPEGRREELYYESYVQDCRERRATAASVFQMNNSGFHAEITLEKENLVFFSVPYDDGFTAYVNGQEADIVEVDEGLMAVLCPAGENSIDFVYQPDGIRLSRALTLGGIVVWLAYTAYFVWRKRRTKRA